MNCYHRIYRDCLVFALCLFTIFASLPSNADVIDDIQGIQSNSKRHHRNGNTSRDEGKNTIIVGASSSASKDSTVKPGTLTLPRNRDVHFEYRIGAHDLLEMEVFQVEDLKHTSRVSSSGYISLPLIGQIKVAGLTLEETEEFIRSAYAKDFLQDPHVSIYVKEYESQKYTVEGEVKESGVFTLKGPTTLLQAIATAKGIQELGDAASVVIFRTNPNKKVIGYIVDVEKIRKGEVEDPFIATDDLIVVSRAGDRAFINSITQTLRGFIGFGTIGL